MYRELCFYIKNINSNLDLFPDRLHPNQEGNMEDVSFSSPLRNSNGTEIKHSLFWKILR